MLHYSKMILERMTIDQKLFKKELMKAYKRLSEEDARQLYLWANENFPELVSGFTPAYQRNLAS